MHLDLPKRPAIWNEGSIYMVSLLLFNIAPEWKRTEYVYQCMDIVIFEKLITLLRSVSYISAGWRNKFSS
jgi:hypothetical protein